MDKYYFKCILEIVTRRFSPLLLLLIVLGFNINCSHKNENIINPEKVKLVGKTFKGVVGSMCAETMPPDPCAGSMFYLILKFNSNNVVVTENEIAACGEKVYKNSFTTEWTIKNNEVTIKKLIRYGQPLLIKKLILNRDQLTGSENSTDGNGTEYTFEEIKTKSK